MPNDLGTIAENALNEMEAADENSGGTPPAAPQGDDNAPQGGESEDESQNDDENNNNLSGEEDENAQNGEASQENDEGENDSQEESENEDDSNDDDGAKGKQAQELTDDELLAELERRGKKPEAPEQKDDKKEEAKSLPRPAEVPDDVWGQMNDFQRTVYDKLPYLEARGKDGSVLRVKSHQQIPADFEWINEAAERQFYNIDMPAQSVQAERIANEIKGQTQQQQQQEQFQKEADMVVKGIDTLITQGIVPKITAQPGSDEFNNDPGVQRANQILALRQQYLARGENISVETAGRIFKAENPDLYKPKPTKSPADAERKAASRIIAGSGGRGTSKDAKQGTDAKPKAWPIGTSAEDIADAYADQLD